MKSKREEAIALFKEGYNCSQSVFAAHAQEYGIDRETALRISASFGAGMGRMREVCGAFSGMLMVAGMETGTVVGRDAAGKKANYEVVQKLAGMYKEKNGSIYCKELLGLVPKDGGAAAVKKEFKETTPQERTEEYYKKRPCMELIGMACDIIAGEFGAEEQGGC